MAELADAYGSGPYESNFMQVQVLFPAPNQYNPNQIFQIGNGFGFFIDLRYNFFLNGKERQTDREDRQPQTVDKKLFSPRRGENSPFRK